jgi:hypothetical protein
MFVAHQCDHRPQAYSSDLKNSSGLADTVGAYQGRNQSISPNSTITQAAGAKTMSNLKNRIEKIEKELDIEDKTQWFRLPDDDSPGGFMEIKGCRTLAEFLRDAME